MTRPPYLAGRAFATRLEMPEEPVWAPLEAVARLSRTSCELPSFHEGEFMFMATVRNVRNKLAIHLYKHIDTRCYLNLDDGGHAYAYRGSGPDDASSGGRYQRYRTLFDAVDHLELWLFDAAVPLFRSFPPDAWPADRRRVSSPKVRAPERDVI
jgi:hypothetical protein